MVHYRELAAFVEKLITAKVTDFGKFLSEELITRLFMTKRFEVVERQLLSKVIDEHKLTLAGFVDPNSAKELGKLLGVDAIATGTITDLDATVKINARLIATDTGSIFAVASVEMIKDETIRRLMGKPNLNKNNFNNNNKDQSRQTPADNFSEIFFQEDFSQYDLGDIVDSWGTDISVRGGSEFKYITSQSYGQHDAGVTVDFPNDFCFEFYFLITSRWDYSFSLFLIADSRVEFLIHQNGNFVKANNAKLDLSRDCWPENNKWIKVRIIKKGATLKNYINDCLGPSISVNPNTRFSGFSLRWQVPDYAFARFLGTTIK